ALYSAGPAWTWLSRQPLAYATVRYWPCGSTHGSYHTRCLAFTMVLVSRFLVPKMRCAQIAAFSEESIALSSSTSWSPNAADASGLRIGFSEFDAPFVLWRCLGIC